MHFSAMNKDFRKQMTDYLFDLSGEERRRLNVSELIQCKLAEVGRALQEIRVFLYLEGLNRTDIYFETLKKSNFTAEEASIVPRVRWLKSDNVPTFQWEVFLKKYHSAVLHPTTQKRNGVGKSYLARVKKQNGSIVKTKVCLTSKHIKINNKTRSISPSAFKDQPLWAQIAGEATERKLCSLRKQEAALSKIVKNIAVIKALREKQ